MYARQIRRYEEPEFAADPVFTRELPNWASDPEGVAARVSPFPISQALQKVGVAVLL